MSYLIIFISFMIRDMLQFNVMLSIKCIKISAKWISVFDIFHSIHTHTQYGLFPSHYKDVSVVVQRRHCHCFLMHYAEQMVKSISKSAMSSWADCPRIIRRPNEFIMGLVDFIFRLIYHFSVLCRGCECLFLDHEIY